jgi:hypothetical protein
MEFLLSLELGFGMLSIQMGGGIEKQLPKLMPRTSIPIHCPNTEPKKAN